MAGNDSRAQVQLHEDTLARRRRVLGVDHPDTLTSAFHLAAELAELGEYQAAMGVTQAQHQAQMAELARIGSSRVLMPRHV